MMWEKIKNILNKEGGRCIIVEEGQPSYVVYKVADKKNTKEPDKDLEKVNRDLGEWKEKKDIAKAEESVAETELAEQGSNEIKIENLPF